MVDEQGGEALTMIYEEEVTGAVYGSKQTVEEIGSTNSFGAMDLDNSPHTVAEAEESEKGVVSLH